MNHCPASSHHFLHLFLSRIDFPSLPSATLSFLVLFPSIFGSDGLDPPLRMGTIKPAQNDAFPRSPCEFNPLDASDTVSAQAVSEQPRWKNPSARSKEAQKPDGRVRNIPKLEVRALEKTVSDVTIPPFCRDVFFDTLYSGTAECCSVKSKAAKQFSGLESLHLLF